MKFYIKLLFPIFSIFLLVLNFSSATDSDDYYTSMIGVQKLAKQEQNVVEKLVHYRKKLSETVELITLYLEDYTESMKTIIRKYPALRGKWVEQIPIVQIDDDLQTLAEEISGNPLMAFNLFRRYASELASIQTDLENIEHHADAKEYLHSMSTVMGFPTLNDVTGAAEGLLRLQDTYQLPTNEMGNGVFINMNTGGRLHAADMLFVGVHAINQHKYATGLEWLYYAYQKVLKGDMSLPENIAKGHLLTTRTLHNTEFLKFKATQVELFSNLVNSNYSNIPELFVRPPLLDHPLGYEYDSVYDLHNFKALCRGEQLLSPDKTKGLRCWYSRTNSPLNLISPLKVEQYYQNPPIFQVYDLISDKVINHIKTTAFPHMKRSSVQGFNASARVVSDVRISSVTWLDDLNQRDDLLRKIPLAVKRATGLKCETKNAAEDLQVSCYGSVGGYYVPHMDTLLHPGVYRDEASQEEFNRRGDRVATIMFYLSNVKLGGGTAFPRLGVSAKAVKGSAIIWYNMKLVGERNLLTLHGGCPVLYGNKWVANKWIRLYDQIETRKCGKSEIE